MQWRLATERGFHRRKRSRERAARSGKAEDQRAAPPCADQTPRSNGQSRVRRITVATIALLEPRLAKAPTRRRAPWKYIRPQISPRSQRTTAAQCQRIAACILDLGVGPDNHPAFVEPRSWRTFRPRLAQWPERVEVDFGIDP